jgi:hypothetical protein
MQFAALHFAMTTVSFSGVVVPPAPPRARPHPFADADAMPRTYKTLQYHGIARRAVAPRTLR